MKSVQEVNQLLSQQAPSYQRVIDELNEVFGSLGWECRYLTNGGVQLLTRVVVSQDTFLNVVREAFDLCDAAATFGPRFDFNRRNHEQEAPKAEPQPPVQAQVPSGPSRKVINESISESAKAILAKSLRTQDELSGMVTAFGVKRKEELSDEQAMQLLNQLTEVLK